MAKTNEERAPTSGRGAASVRPAGAVIVLDAKKLEASRADGAKRSTTPPVRNAIPQRPALTERGGGVERSGSVIKEAGSGSPGPRQVGLSGDPGATSEPRGSSHPRDAAEQAAAHKGPPSSGGFAGRIDGASLADLIQMECLRGLTRAVRITSGRQTGYLFFDQGQVVHAELGGFVGDRAAVMMLSWGTGTYEHSERYFTDRPTITTSWQGLLLLAAKEADELGRDEYDEEEETLVLTLPHLQEESRLEGTAPPETAKSGGRGAREGSDLGGEMSPSTLEKSVKQSGGVLETGIVCAVRIDSAGHLLASAGPAETFVETAAYSVRLAELIGEALGLEELQGMEYAAAEKTVLWYRERDAVVALEATGQAELGKYRRKAGISE